MIPEDMIPNDKWFLDKRYKDNQLNGISEGDIIFRIFSYSRLLQLLVEKRMVLLKPHKWDDPFENFLYSSEATSEDNVSISLASLRETAFGSCWSLAKESDAMWRIYSHNKDGVKVRTTVGKLFNTFWKAVRDPALKCYVGKVVYWGEAEIKKLISDPQQTNAIIFDSQGIEQAKSFLIKRKEFEHEQEVRLLYTTTPDQPECRVETFSFLVDPFDLLDEIVFDPRIDKSVYNALSLAIRQLGFTKEISRSSLYELPNMKVTIATRLK